MRSNISMFCIALLATIIASAAHPGEIKIGVATAQTGGLAFADQPALIGFKIAVDELNAKGGMAEKYKIILDVKDTRSDTAATVQAAQELVASGIDVLITPCDADPSIAAGQISQMAGILTFTFCGSTPIITTAVGDYMFGTTPADNLSGAVLATYAISKSYRAGYILKSPDSAYTLRLPEYFRDVFKNKGGDILGEGTYTLGQQDFSAEVTKIKALSPQPEFIMTSAYEPDFPAFLQQLRGAGVNIPIIAADSIDTPTVPSLGAIANGIVHATVGFPTEGTDLYTFYEKFKALKGTYPDSIYVATSYELAYLIDAAVRSAGTIESAALRDVIANLKDYKGLIGMITYAGTQRMPIRDVTIVEIQDGKRKPVLVATPDSADVPAP